MPNANDPGARLIVEPDSDRPAGGSAPDAGPEDSKVPLRGESPIWFESMREGSGIHFRHTSGNSPEKPFPAANGSGVATLDLDLDGWNDLYFANGTTFPIGQFAVSDLPIDHVYRNQGEWRFSDATKVSGLGDPGYSVGLAVGDFNEDGFPDLYVAAVGANHLYCNQGDGTFMDVSSSSKTGDPRWATSTAFLDANNDGLLDLYVCNYAEWSFEANRFCGDRSRGLRMFCSPTLVPPEDDVLFLNRGDGVFDDNSVAAGINARPGRSQGVIAADFSGDGVVDLYVSKDINPNSLLVNSGTGVFRDEGEVSGTAYDHLGRSQAGMGLATADFDRNGLPDLFVTNYENEHNALYQNLGGGAFLEVGMARVAEGSLPYVGWGTAFADFDLDAWPDLVVTNGHTDDNLRELGKEGEYKQPPGLWHNRSGTLTLIASRSGSYFSQRHCGRALLTGDLDNDGDCDLVIGHQDDLPALLRNDSPVTPRPWSVKLTLIGTRSARTPVGAVTEWNEKGHVQRQVLAGGGSYASASDHRLVLVAETPDAEGTVTVRWPDGQFEQLNQLKPTLHYAIIQARQPGGAARVVVLGVE